MPGKLSTGDEDGVGDVADLLAQLFLSRQHAQDAGFPFSTEDIQPIFQGQRISRFSLRLYISDPSMLLAAVLPILKKRCPLPQTREWIALLRGI